MDKIHKFLLEIGIPANVKGFDYLHDAIEIGIKDKNFVNQVTNIYIDIGKLYGVSHNPVERCMRHAVECAFDKWELEKIKEEFKPCNKKTRLTVGDFIARSVLYLSDIEGE